MSDIREIVTKAVVAKGKKVINLKEKIEPENLVYSVLGCWIINHEFHAKKEKDTVEIEGKMEADIWYSFNENKETSIARKEITYKKEIKTREVIHDYLDESDIVMVKMIQHPSCINANIVDGLIEIEILFEALAEVVGETKMQVSITKVEEEWEEEDFTDEINEDFLKT